MEEFKVVLKDGTLMKGWKLEAKDAKRNFCFITGMDEYAKRYEGLAEYFAQNGINVWLLDALGQGLNAESVDQQERWPKDGFNKNVEGIALMVEEAKKNGLPTIQAGHSMGSFLTQRRLELYPGIADKTMIIGSNGGQAGLMGIAHFLTLIIVNKKNWDKPNPFMDNMGLGAYTKAIKDRKTPVDWLSYNEENVNKYVEDPWCGHANTGGFWREFTDGMRKVWKGSEMKKVGKDEVIYLTAGEEDPVGQNGKGVKWLYDKYQKLGIKNVTMKLYPHMRHEIHNEIGKEEVWEDFKNFILE